MSNSSLLICPFRQIIFIRVWILRGPRSRGLVDGSCFVLKNVMHVILVLVHDGGYVRQIFGAWVSGKSVGHGKNRWGLVKGVLLTVLVILDQGFALL